MLTFLADIFMVGHLEAREAADGVASLGIAGPIRYTFVLIVYALSVGTVAIVARSVGANDKQAQQQGAATSFASAILIGIPLAILGVIGFPILASIYDIPGRPHIASDAAEYLWLFSFSVPFYCTWLVATAILRSTGDTTTPMLTAIYGNLINIVGDYIFIFGNWGFPKMGVVGAGLATAISMVCEGLVLSLYLFTRGSAIRLVPSSFRTVTPGSIWRLLRVSAPAAIGPAIMQAGFLVYTKIIAELGGTALSAHRTAITVESLFFMPCYGLSVASSVLIGQSLGAKSPRRAEHGFRESARFAIVLSLLFAFVFVTIPGVLIRIFVPGAQDVVSLARACLMIAAFAAPFMSLSIVFEGVLRGAGDTKSPMLVGSLCTWFVRIPVAYLTAFTLGWALPGVWVTMIVDWGIRVLLYTLIYRKGGWKHVKL